MTIIAFRTLTYAPLDGGPDIAIPIRMYAPQDFGGASKCLFEIDWPHGQLKAYGAGMDDFQAIGLTMQRIGVEFTTAPTTKAAGCGLPSRAEAMAFRCHARCGTN